MIVDDLDHLAEMVANLVVEKLDKRQQLIDAQTLAALAGVSRDWVYQHRSALGCVPLSSGSRPRLRFDRDLALERIRELKGESVRRVRRKSVRASVELLPVRDDAR